uniref:Uncharacterized protein n=1 Tax=Cryptomonas curvata TaxID=233186 RepID=A0A7S0QL89_9CRYP
MSAAPLGSARRPPARAIDAPRRRVASASHQRAPSPSALRPRSDPAPHPTGRRRRAHGEEEASGLRAGIEQADAGRARGPFREGLPPPPQARTVCAGSSFRALAAGCAEAPWAARASRRTARPCSGAEGGACPGCADAARTDGGRRPAAACGVLAIM